MATKPTADRASDAERSSPQPRPRPPRPPVFTRSTVLPAAGIGLVTLILAAQEGASIPIAIVVGVAVAAVVVGMIALKRAFYGD